MTGNNYRVSYGTPSEGTDFPYQVSLNHHNGGGNQFCSGVILSSYIILTAAHCFKDERGEVSINYDHIGVTAGKWANFYSKSKDWSETRTLRGPPIFHEEYDHGNSLHDIAILELAKPFTFTAYITNVLIPTQNMGSSTFLGNYTVSGWGFDPADKERKDKETLKKATVRRFSDTYCTNKWGNTFIPESMTCAAGETNEDACEGDSGGPLTCYRNHTHKGRNSTKKYACGIVSFGITDDVKNGNRSEFRCGSTLTDWPGIYTDVAKHYKWIMHATCKLRQKYQCDRNYFQCCNKLCIHHTAVCDGFQDCGDGSDEKYVCPKLGAKFLALFPKFIYSFTTYRMGIFVQRGNNPGRNYTFTVNFNSEKDNTAVPETSIILKEGQGSKFDGEVRHLRSLSYEVNVKVRDVENDETFYYRRHVVRGGDVRIFIHTDKRAYSAGEMLHFGVYFLDYDPIGHENVTGEILMLDSKNHELARWAFPLEARAVFERFLLAKHLVGGTWKLKAKYSFAHSILSEDFTKTQEQDFEVRARANPDFTMKLGLPDYIPTLIPENCKLAMNIDAYHLDGSGVMGECAVELKIIEENCAREISRRVHNSIVNLHGSSGVRNFDFKDILTEDGENGARLQVKVTLTEKTTGLTLTKISTVRISRFEYKIRPFGMNNVKRAGLPFFIGFRIVDTMNEPFEPALETGAWVNVRHDFSPPSGRVILERGMVTLELNTRPGQTNNVVQVSYRNLTLNYTVPQVIESSARGGPRLHLQIRLIEPTSPNNVIAAGTSLRIHVMATDKVEPVNIAILSHDKLYSASTATLDSRSEFQITYPKDIGQDAQIIVFAFIHDVYVSDSLNLNTLMTPATEEARLSTSTSSVEPGDTVTLNLNVPRNSTVYLIGFDESALEGQEDFFTAHWFAHRTEDTSAECMMETSSGYFDLKRSGMVVATNAPNQTSTPGENICRPREISKCPLGPPAFNNKMGRTFFTRSFINQSEPIDILVKAPQRISSWIVTGYYIRAPHTRAQFLPRISFITFKKFFVSIQLPLSIAEGELLEVPVFIHNYHLASAENCIISYNIQSPTNTTSTALSPTLCPLNYTRKHFIPIPFSSIGINNISVSIEAGEVRASTQKSILVRSRNENHIYVKSSAYLAFPYNLTDSAKSKALFVGMGNPPELAIFPRSRARTSTGKIIYKDQSTKLFVASDSMAFILPNGNHLVPVPESAVDSQLLQFTANLAILSYLDDSKQNESARRAAALQSLQTGYQFQLSLQRDDGSFSESGSKESHRLIWLTAYIIRNIFLARRYIYVDAQVLMKGSEFLKKQQQSGGMFREKGDLSEKDHIPLTAFILLTFVEGQRSNWNSATFDYKNVIDGARNTFEAYYNRKLRNGTGIHNAHAQVLMTYAEHEWFEVNQKEADVKEKYWESILSNGRVRSSLWRDVTPQLEMELLSYVALTNYLRGSHFHAVVTLNKIIFKGLSETGGFLSTTDTAVALMAMAKISGRGMKQDINYKLSVLATHKGKNYIYIQKDHPMVHSLDRNEFTLPPNDRGVRLNAIGKGTVYAQLVHSYFTPPKNRNGTFVIEQSQSQTEGGKITLKICLRKRTDGASGLAVLDVNLPSGYNFLQIPTSQALGAISGHRSHEFVDMNSQVRIMFSSISNAAETCIKVHAIKAFVVKNYVPVVIKAYEFYNTRRVSQFYYTLLE